MTNKQFILQRYDADEGKVFDWAEEHSHIETVKAEDGTETENTVIEHLYAKTLFLSATDSIDNYIEIEAPVAE